MSSPIVTEKPKYGASSDSEESDASEASNDGLENTNKIGSAVVVKGNSEYMEKGKDYSKRSRSRSNSRTKSSREDRRHKEKRQRSNGDEDEDESGSDTESKQYRRRNSYDRDDRNRRNRGRDRRDRDQRRRNEGYWSAYAPSDRYYGENRNRNWGRNKEWRDSRGWEDDGWTRDEDRKRNRNREYELDQEKSRRDKERNSRRRRERSHSEDKENSQKKSRKDREEQRDTSAAAQGKVNDGGSSDSVREKDLPSKNLTAEKPVKQPEIPKKAVDILTTKTGGAYIPPAKLKLMQKEITDKSSIAYQRLSWEALKKSIHGLINRVNTSNIAIISVKLMSENIVRGRGLLCRSLMQAQAASPTFSNVFAALISIINTRFPATVELLIKRLVVQFRRSFRRNDKTTCINTTTFLAHLINMDVVHEILALEILTLLVENPTDHSIEVAISFLKECGPKIQEVSAAGLAAVFDSLRHILHEGQLDKRVQYMIEVMFQMRKEFGKKEIISSELDLVDENEVRTHVVTLEDAVDPQDILNVFKFDPDFVENEEKYQALKKVIVGDFSDASGSENEGSDEEDDDEEDDEEDNEKEGEGVGEIIDSTETNLVSLRRTIYLTITSSLDFEECAHKLSCLQLRPGQEPELCHMFLDCCSQQRTYEKFYGLLAQRFCQMRKVCVGAFEQIFKDSYETIHRLETNKLRNVAKFFAHLLFTDAISWDVLGIIKLDMEHTNPSSRIFVKILFQELSEYMGLQKLNERVKDPTLQTAFEGLFPRHDPKDTRFAINFFTSIGLGGLTDELRSHLKNLKPKPTIEAPNLNSSSSDSSSSSTSSSSSSSSESSSDSDSSSDSSSSASSSSDDSSDSDEKGKRKSSKKKATMKKKRKLSPKKSSQKKNTSKPPKKRSTSRERMKEKIKKKR